MEPRFGYDFSQVRVHTGPIAAESARAIAAKAFTSGHEIIFAEGRYRPGASEGRGLLAHELAHVIHQSMRGAPTIQRQPNSVPPPTSPATDPRKLDRPGAQWPYGPITKHKTAQYDLSTYVAWVKEVERAYGADKQAVLQRLRRLYYSSYSGKGGTDFDRVIADQAGATGTPLDALHISTSALDGLYETNVLRLRDGALIDVSHVLAGLDLKTSGLTFEGGGGEAAYNVSMLGVVTWAGDLASWFANWVAQFLTGKLPTPSEAGPLEADQKVDLLSDMDAQVLAEENVRPSTIEHLKAEGRPIRDPNVGKELSMPVSNILDWYYGVGMGAEQPLKAQRRFAQFVRIASPPIPHHSANADGSGAVTLAEEAQDAIYDAIRHTARLLIVQGKKYPFGEEVLDQHDSQLHEMALRFTRFLRTGLTAGDAPWP